MISHCLLELSLLQLQALLALVIQHLGHGGIPWGAAFNGGGGGGGGGGGSPPGGNFGKGGASKGGMLGLLK